MTLTTQASIARRSFLGGGLALGALSTGLPARAEGEPGQPGQLTCHVLDTFSGRPGGGMRVDLSRLEAGEWAPVKSAQTVDSGRTAEPLLRGDSVQPGRYLLEFFHADYFRARAYLPSPPFYDRVVHFFEIPKASTRYHITLVAAPWGYTTFRWKE